MPYITACFHLLMRQSKKGLSHQHELTANCCRVGRDGHDVVDNVDTQWPHDENSAFSGACSDERVSKGCDEAEDVDRGDDEKSNYLPETKSSSDGPCLMSVLQGEEGI